MNLDLQDTHKSNGSHHGKLSHRPLNEEVLQSAVEAAKDEVFNTNTAQPHSHEARRLYQRMEDRLTQFVLLEPIKASVMAASLGALMALVLEHRLKRLVGPLR